MDLHPLCELFPLMSEAEYDALAADIRANGLLSPVVTFEGKILDGGHRYHACREIGIEPRFVDLGDRDPVAFVLAANLHRRHMSAGQAAAVVAATQNWATAHPAHRAKEECNVAPLIPDQRAGLSTAADRAEKSGASLRTQKDADRVAKAAPDLAKAVSRGEIPLAKAVETVTGKARKPAKNVTPAAESAEHSLPDDHAPNLAHDLEDAAKEIDRLTALVASLSKNDLAAEVAAWHQKFDQLNGRLQQAIATAGEAKKQAQYYADLLGKIRRKLGVEKNADILTALPAKAA